MCAVTKDTNMSISSHASLMDMNSYANINILDAIDTLFFGYSKPTHSQPEKYKGICIAANFDTNTYAIGKIGYLPVMKILGWI